MRVVPVLFVARYSSTDDLAAFGLANMMIAIVISAASFGYARGLNPMVTKAYMDKQHYLCGLHLNRALLVNTLMFIVQVFILSFSKNILMLLNGDEVLVEKAVTYIFWMLPGMY